MHVQLHSKSHSFHSLVLIGFSGPVLSLAARAPASITYAQTGTAPGEWEQDRVAYMMGTTKQALANNQSITPSQKYADRSCVVYDGFTPAQIQTTDANAELHKALYQAGLAQHGWLEQKSTQN